MHALLTALGPWRGRAVVVAVLGAGVAALLGAVASAPLPLLVALALVGGGAAGALTLAVGLLYRTLHLTTERLEQRLDEHARQLTAWVNVRPLLGAVPVSVGGWAMDPLFAERLAATVLRERPRLVVECGSGSSTLLVATCLARLGAGRVISLDHDADYAERTRELLRAGGFDDIAAVVTAPLVPTPVGADTYRWYDVDPDTLPGPIDLLVVDGPPADTGPLARYPLVPRLRARLSDRCVLLLDDGDRPDETAIARRWADELGATLEYEPGGKGGWILRRVQPSAAPAVGLPAGAPGVTPAPDGRATTA